MIGILEVAFRAHGQPGPGVEGRAVLGAQTLARQRGVRPLSNVTGSARSAWAASQYVIATTATPLGIGTTSTTPGRAQHGVLVERLHLAAEHGALFHGRVQHPGHAEVQAEDGAAVQLGGQLNPRERSPEQRPVFCALSGGFSGGVSRAAASTSSPKVRTAAGRSVQDAAAFREAVSRRDAPALRRRPRSASPAPTRPSEAAGRRRPWCSRCCR